jgi:hypothetical protein
MTSQIALFNDACSLIFKLLYEQFPVPYDFDQRDIGFYQRFDISKDGDNLRRVLQATLEFLRQEGFILYEYHSETPTVGIRNARLTAKGLTKLQRIPEGIKPNAKSLIEQLVDATSSIGQGASSAATTETVKRILGMVLGI